MKELDEALNMLHSDARNEPASLDRAREKLMAEMTEAPTRRPRVWPRLAVAAAAAGVAAAGVVVWTTSDQPPSSPQAAPHVELLSAPQLLEKAAAGTAAPAVAAGQFKFIDVHTSVVLSTVSAVPVGSNAAPTGYSYLIEQREQKWIPSDYRQVWLDRRMWLGEPKWVGGTMPQDQTTVPKPADYDNGDRSGACGDFFPKAKPKKVCGDPDDWASPAFYEKLPRDVDGLYATMQGLSKAKGGKPDTTFHAALLVLQEGLLPADLQPLWYKAMARIPGVTVLDRAVNLDGRTGTALGFKNEAEQRELIIDPASGDYIGQRTVAGDKPYDSWIKPGTVTQFSSFTVGVATKLGEAPAK
ncbi:CU044_5270 family protein [Actinocrispum sp. NPDC049592]|uniref:CU044_5270 family protein n=1 Tax=Actinocrispum sp. NPDC049592 TaxID=3154835 RepID=UPI003420C23A